MCGQKMEVFFALSITRPAASAALPRLPPARSPASAPQTAARRFANPFFAHSFFCQSNAVLETPIAAPQSALALSVSIDHVRARQTVVHPIRRQWENLFFEVLRARGGSTRAARRHEIAVDVFACNACACSFLGHNRIPSSSASGATWAGEPLLLACSWSGPARPEWPL